MGAGDLMRLITIVLFASLALPATEIPKGAHALLKLVNSVSTRTAREGDYVYLRTATPIVADGAVIVPVDSYVTGVVTHSKRSGRVTGRAELSIRIETLTLNSGKVVKMSPSLATVDSEGTEQRVVGKEGEVKQGGTKGADAEKIATTGGVGAAIGGLADRSWKGAGIGAGAGAGVGLATVLLTRGKEVELRQGTTIDVVFDRAIPMD
jgi:type IV secretion system protein VirB10